VKGEKYNKQDIPKKSILKNHVQQIGYVIDTDFQFLLDTVINVLD